MNKHDLTHGSINSNLFKAAVPLIIAMLVETGYNIVDTIFVGRLGPEAIAAVTLAFPVIFFIFAIGGGIATGASALIAQEIGAKKYKEADNVAEHTILIALVLAVIFTGVGLVTMRPLFSLLGAGPSVLGLAVNYIRVLYIGSTLMFLAMTGIAILRGVGDMKMQMKIMVFSAIINATLDPILIFVLGLGVKGAALSTVIARLVGCIMVYNYLFRGKTVLRFSLNDFKLNFSFIKRILKVGLPTSISQMMMSMGWATLAKIASLFGPIAIAALGIGFRIDMVAVLPTMGLGIAIITIVGQNLGAKKPERAKQSTVNAIGFGAVYLLLLTTVFYLFPEHIIRVFSSNSLLIKYTVAYIRLISPAYFFIALGMIVGSAILGTGKPLPQLVITVVRLLVVAVPLAYLFSVVLDYGVVGIWIGSSLATVISGIISLIWYYRISWRVLEA